MAVAKRLQEALKILSTKKDVKDAPKAFKMIIWELMTTQSQLLKVSEALVKTRLEMDKKIHKITEAMKKAEADVKKGKSKAAVHVLKSAEKKNEKLVKEDKNVRDPLIDKAKKLKSKFPKDWGKVK